MGCHTTANSTQPLLTLLLASALLALIATPAGAAPASPLESVVRELTARGSRYIVLVEGAQPLSSWELRANRTLGSGDTSAASTKGWVVSTGVVMDAAGNVAAPGEKLGGCTRYQVRNHEGRVVPAIWVGYDETSHLALLRAKGAAQPAPAPPQEIATDGQWVAILSGAPGGALTASLGVAEHSLGSQGGIATSAATGAQGGVMVDGQGRWLGISTPDQPIFGHYAELASTDTPILSHAWTRSEIVRLIDTVNRGAVPTHDRPYLGVRPEAAPPAETGGAGVRIAAVVPGSPAAAAGLRPGDVVTRFNARAVDDVEGFSDRVLRAQPGSHITLTFNRGPASLEKEVVLGSYPAVAPEDTASADQMFRTELGRFRVKLSELKHTITGR